MKSTPKRLLRIPVRAVEDRWECEYGGLIPVASDAMAEIVIDSSQISDPAFLKRMTQKGSIKVLEEGTPLLACLAVKEEAKIDEELRSHLVLWEDPDVKVATGIIKNCSSARFSFAEVTIGDLTENQAEKFDSKRGGLWLLTEGPEPVGLQSSRIVLPPGVSDEPVVSLNHAFTRLSEIYEPWRMSHTGSVYERFLYKEKNGLWYPLELLRRAALAKTEQAIAHGLWQDFMTRMSPVST